MIGILDISTTGLTAQRTRMDAIAGNIANASTTRDAYGQVNPYQRRFVVFQSGSASDSRAPGVHVASIEMDSSPPRLVHDPGHPDANESGYVAMPNVDPTMEYINAIEASRAYEANVSVMDATKSMIAAAMMILP